MVSKRHEFSILFLTHRYNLLVIVKIICIWRFQTDWNNTTWQDTIPTK